MLARENSCSRQLPSCSSSRQDAAHGCQHERGGLIGGTVSTQQSLRHLLRCDCELRAIRPPRGLDGGTAEHRRLQLQDALCTHLAVSTNSDGHLVLSSRCREEIASLTSPEVALTLCHAAEVKGKSGCTGRSGSRRRAGSARSSSRRCFCFRVAHESQVVLVPSFVRWFGKATEPPVS